MEQDGQDGERATQDGGVEVVTCGESGRGEQEDNLRASDQLRRRRQIPSMERTSLP